MEGTELENHSSNEMNVKPGEIEMVSKCVLGICRQNVLTLTTFFVWGLENSEVDGQGRGVAVAVNCRT